MSKQQLSFHSTIRGVLPNSRELEKKSFELRKIAKKEKKCALCGSKLEGRRRIYCSYECSRDFSLKYYGESWTWIRDRIIKRDNHTCKLCNEKELYISSCHCEVDHILEVDRGGDDKGSNLRVLCHSCHRMKTDSYIRKKNWTEKAPSFLCNPDDYLLPKRDYLISEYFS